jgi:DNA-binding GntR family transcriptional regulator
MIGNVNTTIGASEPDRTIKIERPKKNLRELVQDALREAILDLRLKPGERLVERALCSQLGVSRTVVREVLRYLEAEGLVENSPNRGPVVATIKPEEAEQIYEIRSLLEGMAAAACAELATPEDLKRLEISMKGLLTARQTNDARLSLKATSGFYQTVFAVSQKRVAWNVVEALYLRINALRAVTITTSDRQIVSVGEMERIYEAIVAGDAAAARRAARAHLTKSYERYAGLREQADAVDLQPLTAHDRG